MIVTTDRQGRTVSSASDVVGTPPRSVGARTDDIRACRIEAQ
jgi:hypothetical protein